MTCCNTTPHGRLRASMLICHDCRHRRDLPIGNGGELVSACTAEPAPRPLVALTVCGKPTCGLSCPVGRHPDEDGVVRAGGARWLGIPWPRRLLHRRPLAWLGWDRWSTEPEGCGCLLVLKRLSLELCVWREAATFDAFGRGGPPWRASTWGEVRGWVARRARQTGSTGRPGHARDHQTRGVPR